MKSHLILTILAALSTIVASSASLTTSDTSSAGLTIHVDPAKGRDSAKGTKSRPLASLSAAIAKIPVPLDHDVTIQLAAGRYETTGGREMPKQHLELMLRMRPAGRVVFVGPKSGKAAILCWNGERNMIDVRDGHWAFRRVTIGDFEKTQRRGITVRSPAHVMLDDVSFRLRSS